MRISELIEKIEKKFPLEFQEKWDNSGFLIGNIENELKNVLVCLEITPETIDEAKVKNCNMIISHHPLIFSGIKKIDMDFKGKKILELIKNDIALYSTHTAIDVNGLNEYIFEKIGFTSEGIISPTVEKYGYGNYQSLRISEKEIISRLKDSLGLEYVVKYGKKEEFYKVGLITGSGMDFINEVKALDIDLFITGDIKHHEAMDSVEMGINLIDITHQGSEKYFAEYMKKFIDDMKLDITTFEYYNIKKYVPKIL